MSGEFTAAAVQFEPTLFNKEHNIRELLRLVQEAADGGARLITIPEMATTGYCFFDEHEAEAMAEPVPGPTIDRFAAVAAERSVHIVVGMPEREIETGLLYNAAVLVGPKGVIGTHRKSHPYIAEPKWAAPGNRGHRVFDTELGRIALLICMDIHFVETARLVALEGADVICHISNWLAERTPAPYWISRAYENSCYLVESNRWGLERGVQFSGGSCIIAPDSTVVASRDSGDGVVHGRIDPEFSRELKQRQGSALSTRRPELYRELQKNTFLWNPLEFFSLYGRSPLPPGRPSVVTVVQETFDSSPSRNTDKLLDHLEQASSGAAAELVVFPELSISGAAAGQGDLQVLAEESGRELHRVAASCARLNVWALLGLYESAGPSAAVHNSLVLVGPGGVAARHHKVHVPAEETGVTAGSTFTVADIPVGRIGIAHGEDIGQPETGRILALRGCDLVAVGGTVTTPLTQGHPGSVIDHGYPIPHGEDPVHWHHMRVRAGENNVYLAFANTPAGGASGIFGPDTFSFPRTERIATEGSSTATMTVDTTDGGGRYPNNVVRRKDLVSMRLPHHYGPLSAADREKEPEPASEESSIELDSVSVEFA
ncbi:amidohydrolase [Prauserella halophila]|uniref:Amidohydrolase n=1 Tax=Prauserella halophila TaxID=185641 RepID=A0ABP4GRV9_9PSEU|nr:nitrilase-related carbon-nitrogen hydrolase [Prauserella halophila]MCP2235804.1 putative amidohydrolase [Prauserella halophila]